MNAKANAVLDNIRKTLEHDLGLENTPDTVVTETEVEEGDDLTEAEVKFCEEGLAFIEAAKYELEGFEEVGPDEIIEALEEIAADEPALAPKVVEFFKRHGAEAA